MNLNIQILTKISTVNITWSSIDNANLYKLKIYSEDGLLCYIQDIKEKCSLEILEVSLGDYYCQIEAILSNGKVVNGKSEYFSILSGSRPILDTLINLSIKDPDFDKINKLVKNSPLSLKHAFMRFRSIFHSGGVNTNKSIILNVVESILKEFRLLIPSQTLFLLSMLVYGKNSEWLIKNYDEVYTCINESGLPLHEELFLEGLLNYKIGNFHIAQRNFSKIIPYKKYLQSHQWSSLNYVYSYDNKNSYEYKLKDFTLYKEAKLYNEGVVLISCDWGYYLAYHDLIDSKIDNYQLNIHYHLVLPKGFPVSDLNTDVHKRVGVSYEIEPLETREQDKNYKTYYSIVRYLVADKVSRLYDQKILISDVDINFENNISEVFNMISDDEAALVFSKSDLPWTKIMAGFNVFGKNFFSKDFYLLLCNFLIENLDSGLNFWMLDQVALDVAYVNSDRNTVSYIKSMNTLIDFKILQQQENSKYKYLARDNIIKKISEIKNIS